MTADRLTPQHEAERVQGVLYEAITAFQNVAKLSSLQHAQMRGYLAEHLAPTLLAELAAVRAQLAHAVPHARELALKDASRWLCEESPNAAFDRIHEAAQDAQREANAALDKAVAR